MKTQRKLEPIDNRQMDTLRVFHEVARALTSNLELDPLLRTIMHQMEEFFGPEKWSLMLVNPEDQHLYYVLSAGIDERLTRAFRLAVGEGIAGHVAASGQPLVIPDISADPEWSVYARQHPELNLRSIACLPIRHGRRTLAVMQLHNSNLDLLPESSISFLRVLCDYAAIALENARQVNLIHQLTITDDCTGLFNARHLYTLLEEEIAALKKRTFGLRRSICFSLLFFDLDHFKSINDTHGHLVGTRLLAEVANVIKRVLGPNHPGVRYGGDEFVGLLRGLDKRNAAVLANQLRDALNETEFLTANNLSVHISASFGLATFPEDGDTIQAIIRSADTMMYAAKAAGRDQIAVADPRNPAPFPAPKVSRHS
jgi:diguanylate cyclase (GGDEF)-like protein